MKVALSSIITLLGVGVQLVTADWQFHSRQDLSPPRLNITVPADRNSVEKGYIFIAPYPGFGEGQSGPDHPGAYIFRDDGELVWSGIGYFGGWVANFRPDVWDGEPVLRGFHGQLDSVHGRMIGQHVLLNNKYETIKTIRAGSHQLASAHEFKTVGGRTALIEVAIIKAVDLSPWGGREDQNWVVSSGFQELDIETGEVLFEWESFDHVDPKYSAFPLNGERSAGRGTSSYDAYDYFHLNSADKNERGEYLISARNTAALYKINGTSGEVIWQLGGLNGGSTFEVDEETKFAYQHDARFLSESTDGRYEVISFFDNASAGPFNRISLYSRARIVEIDHQTKKARSLQIYPAPDGLSAPSQGNAQILPNGNAFVNWGQAGAVTEFSPDGAVLFHAYLDSRPEGNLVQSYRGFRSNWTATSAEDPAIVVLLDEGSPYAEAYVSWNGDTETAAWRFYAETSGAPPKLIGEVHRGGFETHLRYTPAPGEAQRVFAEAVDALGRVLGRSRAVKATQGVQRVTMKSGEGGFWGSGEL